MHRDFDNESATLAQYLAGHHFSYLLPIYTINLERSAFSQTAWSACARNRAIVIVNRLDIYAQAIRDVELATEMQTILISTHANNTDSFNLFACDSRFLFVDLADSSSHTSNELRLYAWRQGVRVSRRTARTAHELWNRDHLYMQLFWGSVQHVSHMPIFRARIVPPLHINTCTKDIDAAYTLPTCHIFGLYVLLINFLNDRLCMRFEDCQPNGILTSVDGYDEWFSGFFSAPLSNSDLLMRRNIRDAVQQHRYVSEHQHLNNNDIEQNIITIGYAIGTMHPIYIEDIVLVVTRRPNMFRSEWYLMTTRLGITFWCLGVALLAATVQYGSDHLNTRLPPRGYMRNVMDAWARTLCNTCSSSRVKRPLPATERLITITLSLFAIYLAALAAGNELVTIINNMDVTQIKWLDELLHISQRGLLRIPLDSFNSNWRLAQRADIELKMARMIQWHTLSEIQLQWSTHDTSSAWIIGALDTGQLQTRRLRQADGELLYYVSSNVIGNSYRIIRRICI